MNLRMVREPDGAWRTEILCEYCGNPIDNIAFGMVIWTDPAGHGRGSVGDAVIPRVIHKGRCDQATVNNVLNQPWYELYSLIERWRHRMLNEVPLLQTNQKEVADAKPGR